MKVRKETRESNEENSPDYPPLKKRRPAQQETGEMEKTVRSLYSKKLQDIFEYQAEKGDDYNLIINFQVLKNLITMIG